LRGVFAQSEALICPDEKGRKRMIPIFHP